MKDNAGSYDVAVVGGGAAGTMAAIRAGRLGRRVILLERNDSIGKKVMITGKGRCNITNTAAIDVFIDKFKPVGEFYRTAFFAFSSDDLKEFFGQKGLELKAERQGRVFPVTDKARSIVSALQEHLHDANVEIVYNKRIVDIKKEAHGFVLTTEDGSRINAAKAVIATGGASYSATGSTGDGFEMAGKLSHRIARLKPALVPLVTKERWVKELQGVSLENVRISFKYGNKRHSSDVGEMMITHFGVSGPLVLDMSGDVVSALEKEKEIPMAIDLKPGLKREQLESKLVHKFTVKGNIYIRNLMQDILPKRMIDTFLSLAGVAPEKRTNQMTREERNPIIDLLKAFPLTIVGSLPIEEAMVTSGGVSIKEINPRTMESRLVPGLYFAGEVIEGSAPSGGYNLQQAFSTGYLAGEKAGAIDKILPIV